MTRDAVLSKVRKLLNMTTANGCTEAEAITAAGLAQKLMLQHSLDVAMLPNDAEPEEELRRWEDPLDVMSGKMKQHWRGVLAVVVARHNGCTVFWDRGPRNPVINIVGRASDVVAARYIYSFCVNEITQLANGYRGNGATWLNNYRHGVVSGISEKMHEARRAVVEETVASGTALIVVQNALAVVDKKHSTAVAFAKREFNLRPGGRPGGYRDDNAREQGRRDGRNINVSGQRRLK